MSKKTGRNVYIRCRDEVANFRQEHPVADVIVDEDGAVRQ